MSVPELSPVESFPRTSSFVVDRSARARLWVSGPDRARFLHNLCTQDILGLAAGAGREAFLTSPQGRTLAHVTVHATEGNALLVRCDPGCLEPVLPHLEKYGIFDDVGLDERTLSTCEWHLAGTPGGTDAVLARLGLNLGTLPSLGCKSVVFDGHPLTVIREAPFGREGWTLIAPADQRHRWPELWSQMGSDTPIVPATNDTLEGLRIEAGTLRGGQDVTPENLPQELDRDAQAICFTKGCYLGQETVARLDALGHVNKLLRRLMIEGTNLPARGATVRNGEREIGTITSVGWTPEGRVVALAMLRVNLAPVGATVEVADPSGPRRAVVQALSQSP